MEVSKKHSPTFGCDGLFTPDKCMIELTSSMVIKLGNVIIPSTWSYVSPLTFIADGGPGIP